MDIASMVLGIISIVFSFFCGCISMITAPIGLILGIVDLILKKKKGQPIGIAISGVVMCTIAILIIVLLVIVFSLNLNGVDNNFYNEFFNELNQSQYY